MAAPTPSKSVVLSTLSSKLDQYAPHLKTLLPINVDPARLTRLAIIACSKNPDLLNCTQQSIILGVLRIAQLNLELGVTAHLVPFGKEAQCIVDYKGTIELAMRSGYVSAVDAWLVHEHDVFDVHYGTDPGITHLPRMADRGKPVAAYAVYTLTNGAKKFDVMTTEEIEQIRNGRMGPWHSHWGEMAKKTVVRRCGKLIPQSAEMSAAWAMQDKQEGYSASHPLLDEGEALVSELVDGVVSTTEES